MKSSLCIFDIITRTSRTILETDDHIEAPNWTPDGSALLVNGGGRLFRVALDAPGLAEIDTGFARHMWTPPSSSLSSKRVESGWVLAYVRPRSAAGWPRALMISADHGPYQIIALLGAVSRTGFPDPRQNR